MNAMDDQHLYMQDQQQPQIGHDGRVLSSSDPDLVPMDEYLNMDDLGQSAHGTPVDHLG